MISHADETKRKRALISRYAYQCPESPLMTSCADQCRFAGSHRKNASARISSHAHRSTFATIRNNQATRPSHNDIVMMQMSHLQNHKQRKRNNTNNASVISANVSPGHNAIVICRLWSQAFVTFCNISSAYHFHKLGLSVQTYYVTVENRHKYACTIVRLYYYASMLLCAYNDVVICTYADMSIKTYNDSVMMR